MTICGLFIFIQIFSVTKWFKSIFGGVNWQRPNWLSSVDDKKKWQYPTTLLNYFLTKVKENPKTAGGISFGIVLLMAFGIWWVNQPVPVPPGCDRPPPAAAHRGRGHPGSAAPVMLLCP